jgi:hypothetical protein
MSDSDRFLNLNSTAPIPPIEDLYKITKGDVKDWNLKGYHVPSTSFHSPRSYKVPTERKKDTFYEISKRSKDPDPTTYSPKHEQIQKRFWEKANGKFLKSRRETVTEEAGRLSLKVPGPGDYHPVPKGSSQPLPRALMGKFE